MKKLCVKITAVVLSVSLCLSQCVMPVFAEEISDARQNSSAQTESVLSGGIQTSDDAAIYVITDTEGKKKKVIVSDEIKGALKNAAALSEKTLSNHEDANCFDIDGNPLSWVENVEDEMPVELSVRYTLDGKSVSADELAGKSGHVTMTYHYRNRLFQMIDGMRVAVPFMVLTGVIADDQVFSNLKVSNGKCIDDGNRTIVVGFAMPGLQDDLNLDRALIDLPEEVTIEGDASDFELDSVMTLITNEVFSQLDTSSLDNVASMLSAADQLSVNMKKLIDGSTELSGGIGTLLMKSSTLVDAVGQLSDGAAALASGANQLDEGLTQLQDGAADLSEGLNTLSEGGKELSDAASKIFDVFLKACNFVLPLLPGFPEEYQKITAENYSVVLDQIAEFYSGKLPFIKESMDALKKIGQFSQGICAYIAGVDQAAEGAKALNEGIAALKNGSETLSEGLNALSGGTQELNGQTPQLVDGIRQLNDGSLRLTDGLKQFNSQGIEKLTEVLNGDLGQLPARFKATANAAKQYRIFDGITGIEGQVSYIYKTESLKKKE